MKNKKDKKKGIVGSSLLTLLVLWWQSLVKLRQVPGIIARRQR
jgi:hypothetical protein